MATEKQSADVSVVTHVQDISSAPKSEQSSSKGDVESTEDATLPRATDPIIAETPKRTWRSYIWDSLDKDPKERRLVFKLDCALLTIGCLGYFVSSHPSCIPEIRHVLPYHTVCLASDASISLLSAAKLVDPLKVGVQQCSCYTSLIQRFLPSRMKANLWISQVKFLDQVNINNAFVSGMKEDLGMLGNQLNYMQTAWSVGYVLGGVPSNILLTRVRPSLFIPCIEVMWGVLTFSLVACKSWQTMCAVRFFVGLFESALFPGFIYIIGSWYRKDELAKRTCIFQVTNAIGGMFSGYLMAATYHLEGVGGFKGWQW